MTDGKGDVGKVIIGAGVAGGTFAVVNKLLAGKPVEAAPTEAKWNYLIECQECIIALLGQLVAAGVPGVPGIEVSVSTPWVAKTPVQIYSYAIRTAGTFYSDMMVDWTKGKRFLIKVESTLDVACNVYPIGNFVDNMDLAADIGPIINVPANENHSIGLAWDDWHCFVGVRITTAAAPASGILNIWAVIQE